jgi:uncharacterized protein YoxC
MELIIQISIAVIAVAFVVLLFFLIQAVKTLTGTLEETRMTIGQLRTEVTQISVDVKEGCAYETEVPGFGIQFCQ